MADFCIVIGVRFRHRCRHNIIVVFAMFIVIIIVMIITVIVIVFNRCLRHQHYHHRRHRRHHRYSHRQCHGCCSCYHPSVGFSEMRERKPPFIPEEASPHLRHLLKGLLAMDSRQRLGQSGAEEVKRHPFFKVSEFHQGETH